MIEDLSLARFISTTLAGAITTLLPCTYPMVVGYIALVLGDKGGIFKIAKTTFWFFLGFSITYVFFGSIAGVLGQFSKTTIILNSFKPLLVTLGGIFLIVIGIVLIFSLNLPWKLNSIKSIPMPKFLAKDTWWKPSLLGVIFSASWSPCIGPILGGVLVLAASTGSSLEGSLLLLAFSFGMIIPMLIIAIIYKTASEKINIFQKIIPFANLIGGILFITIGILFIAGDLSAFSTIKPPEFLQEYI